MPTITARAVFFFSFCLLNQWLPLLLRCHLEHFHFLLCTGECGEVRLFLRKSRVGMGCSVCTRSENALDALPDLVVCAMPMVEIYNRRFGPRPQSGKLLVRDQH